MKTEMNTYGYIPSYEEHIEERQRNGGKAFKIGIREEYEMPDGTKEKYLGGAIWKTPEEAVAYIQYLFSTKKDGETNTKIEDWGVYEIDGNWDDVYYIEDEMFHRLREDRQIIGRFR